MMEDKATVDSNGIITFEDGKSYDLKNPLESKGRVTKELYKAYDSNQRREKWILRNLLRIIKQNYITENSESRKIK